MNYLHIWGAIKIIHLFVFTAAGPQLAKATKVVEEVVVIVGSGNLKGRRGFNCHCRFS